MPSVFGSALMTLGERIPQITAQYGSIRDRQRQQEIENEERKRKEALFAQQMKGYGLQQQLQEADISDIAYRQAERETAEKNFLDYVSDRAKIEDIPKMAEAGPSPEHEKLVELEELGGMTPSEQLQKYDLISGSAFSPKVKAGITPILEEESAESAAKRKGVLDTLGTQNKMAMKQFESGLTSAENRRAEAAMLALEREKLASKEKTATEKLEASKGNQSNLKENLISQLETVMNHPAKYSGISFGRLASLAPTESRDFKRQIEKLKSMTTLENLKYLKGAMSDKDVKFIQEASTALDLGGSMTALDRELNKMYNAATSTDQQSSQLGSKLEGQTAQTITYQGEQIPSYNSEDEAIKAGAKGRIYIRGLGIGSL